MQSNANYLASAHIDQYDLLTIDTESSNELAVYLKPATTDDVIIGRANSKAEQGDMVVFQELIVGVTIACIAGESISKGDFLAPSSGKAVKGATELMAIDAGSAGDKIRCVLVEKEVSEPEPPEPPEPFDPLSMVPGYNSGSGYAPTLSVGDIILLGWGDTISNAYPGQEFTGDKFHVIVFDTANVSIGEGTYKLVQQVDFGNQYSSDYKFKIICGGPARANSADEYTPVLCMVSAVPAST